MTDFTNPDEIRAFAEANGVEALRFLLVGERLQPRRREAVRIWLEHHDAQVKAALEETRRVAQEGRQQEYAERAVLAAEAQAAAAKVHARAAEKSLSLSRWALFIAVAAALGTIAQAYFAFGK